MSEFPEKNYKIRTLDDIVFETRNREYGCYHLRSTYRRRLIISVLWSFSIFLFSVVTIFLLEIQPWNKQFNNAYLIQSDSISYDREMVTLLSQLTEIKPDKTMPPLLTLEPKPVSEAIKELTEHKEIPVTELKPILLPQADTSHKRLVDDLLRRHENQVNKDKSIQTDSISMILEKVPQFPGGYAAVQAYFLKNQHYPENALIHGIHGSTVVSFVVNFTGDVDKASVVKGIDPELDQEAIRLVKTMPRWQPAYYKGKPIASMLIMPVNFTIK
jgi:periplasmic protein TonB